MRQISNDRIVSAVTYAMDQIQQRLFQEHMSDEDMDEACESLHVLACLKSSLTQAPVHQVRKAA